MKTTIAILLIIISVNCFGQGAYNGNGKLKDEATKVEPAKLVMPPDSIAIVSLKDYNTFFVWLQENISKSNYDKLTPDKVLTEFLQWAIVEWNRKKKGGK